MTTRHRAWMPRRRLLFGGLLLAIAASPLRQGALRAGVETLGEVALWQGGIKRSSEKRVMRMMELEPPAPDADQAPAPDADQAPTPDADQAPTPDADQAPTPDADQAPTPDADQAPTPDADQAPTPDADEVDPRWERLLAELPAAGAISPAARGTIARKNPSLDATQLAAMTARFERELAADTIRNELALHAKLHGWLAGRDVSARSLDALDARVQRDLFLAPSSDPWVGLVPGRR